MWDVTRSLSATARELRALSAERSNDFVAPGILSTLYALMTVESSIVATDAAGAIANLSNHEATRKAIVESGGLASLVKQLSPRDATLSLAIEAARALGNLANRAAASEVNYQDMIRAAGAIGPLVALLLENPRSGAAVQTALALRNLAHENAANQDAIRDAGGIGALVMLLSTESAASQEAARALRNLARNNAANKEALRKAGGVTPLLAALRTDTSVQNTSAAMVLCNLVNMGGSMPGSSTAVKPASSAEGAELLELDNLLELNTDGLGCAPCEPCAAVVDASRNTSPTMRGSTSPATDLHDPPPAAPPTLADAANPSRAPVLTGCWAVLLRGSEEGCDLSFRVVGSHLQEKFCSRCRANGVLIPRSKVRALPPQLCSAVSNGKSEGFWTDGAPLSLAHGGYRLINHTQGCEGPRLIVLESSRDAAAEGGLDWPMLPAAWVESGEHIRLWISRGTLVPRKPRKSFCPSAEGGSVAGGAKRQRAAGVKHERVQQPAVAPAAAPATAIDQSAAARYHALLASRGIDPTQLPRPAPGFEAAHAAHAAAAAAAAYEQQQAFPHYACSAPSAFAPAPQMRADSLAIASTLATAGQIVAAPDAYGQNVFRPRLIPTLGPYTLA
mmetsp:Transcript_21287/g.63053  ORF Transcript_21287/g.63053 Transcript_21287/m.63053 type:complete len:619 (-) Transcript_21287:174-2030(-)